MWLFTKYGFFSVVSARDSSGGVDIATLQVRARLRGHLVSLIERFELAAEVVETRDADYRFRILVPKTTWSTVAGELATEINYANFKGEVARRGKEAGV